MFLVPVCAIGAFAVSGITKYYDGTDDVSMV
jgi:hypothetical protein